MKLSRILAKSWEHALLTGHCIAGAQHADEPRCVNIGDDKRADVLDYCSFLASCDSAFLDFGAVWLSGVASAACRVLV